MSRSFLSHLLLAAGLLVAGCTGAGSGASSVPSSAGTATSAPSVTPSAAVTPSPAPTPSASPRGATVVIYLVEDPTVSCDATRAVKRAVAAASPEAALRALLAGPTSAEITLGYSSWFSAATADMLDGMSIADGVAHVSFRDLRPVIPSASSSCGSAALLSALDETLRQFPEVRSTRYSILGDEAAFYEWLQRGVPAG